MDSGNMFAGNSSSASSVGTSMYWQSVAYRMRLTTPLSFSASSSW